jgi:PD-(D/E)XK nuclease superfamily
MKAPVESPYLQGTNIRFAWDSTSLEMFKACPRLYYYTLICGWQPKGENVHLRFGNLYHKAMQNYDLSLAAGIKPNEAVFDVVKRLLEESEDWWTDHELAEMRGSARNKTRTNLVKMVVWRFEKYKDDAAKTYIRKDGDAAVEQTFQFDLDWGPQSTDVHYLLCGHLDKIVDYAGELYVMDYKTSFMPLSKWFFEKFEPHNQMTMYSLAAKVVLEAPVKGVIIEAAHIEEPQKKNETGIQFARDITTRTSAQLDEWVKDLRYWLGYAEQCAIDDHWPLNDTSCDRFGGCKFRGVCSKSPQVRERFLEADFIKLDKEDIWNPLKNR